MSLIKIRKVVNNSHCEFLGTFEFDDIREVFRKYSGQWMEDHPKNSDGFIINAEIAKYLEVADEFNLLEADYFLVGFPVTHFYEGIVEGSDTILIFNPDEHGFETQFNEEGTKLLYLNNAQV